MMRRKVKGGCRNPCQSPANCEAALVYRTNMSGYRPNMRMPCPISTQRANLTLHMVNVTVKFAVSSCLCVNVLSIMGRCNLPEHLLIGRWVLTPQFLHCFYSRIPKEGTVCDKYKIPLSSERSVLTKQKTCTGVEIPL